jgi:hypothetical protein
MRRRAAFVLALALLGTTACDDEPTCTMLVELSGGLSGNLTWNLAGTDQCGFADADSVEEGSRAMVIMDRTGDGYIQFIILVREGLPAVGMYSGQVLIVTPDDIWQSGSDACTVVVSSSEVEDWSKIDFVQLDGVVDCPDPLPSLSGASPPVTMTTMGYKGHLFAKTLQFENL